jgi:hypothetical protein
MISEDPRYPEKAKLPVCSAKVTREFGGVPGSARQERIHFSNSLSVLVLG